MRVIDVGDRGVAVLVEGGDAVERRRRVRGLANALAAARLDGVTDLVASPGRVTVVYDPLRAEHPRLRLRIDEVAQGPLDARADVPEVRHEIPVCYGGAYGPDFAELCSRHAIDRQALIDLHTAPDYVVETIGFLPGFGYLAGLPERLATPRRDTPRRLVPAGSVGIGGTFTAAYPFASPGGWNLVGATPARLFDASRPQPALVRTGDRVRFTSIDHGDFATFRPDVEEPVRALETVGITVLAPGLWTTIQDLGRPGHRADGVPLSGAADAVSLRLANRLVGNPATAAGLEITLLGPTLRFERAADVAIAGAAFPEVPSDKVLRMAAGDVLTLGHATAGCRSYLAVAGGIDVPPVLGSRSTLVTAGLGGLRGRQLVAGDALPIGRDPPGRPAGRLPTRSSGMAAAPVTLRVVAGEQIGMADRFWGSHHVATSRSDRMGVRLDGPTVATDPVAADLPSVAVLPGTIQLPPDGRPIILLADAQTIGGYPVVGHVIAADLPRAAQLRPGSHVQWRQVTIAEAHQALRDLDAALGGDPA
ncbi:MAG: 5-oxoprolinase subunit PxpB [Planctomycetota bacterium]